jgi:hypothetical protein
MHKNNKFISKKVSKAKIFLENNYKEMNLKLI